MNDWHLDDHSRSLSLKARLEDSEMSSNGTAHAGPGQQQAHAEWLFLCIADHALGRSLFRSRLEPICGCGNCSVDQSPNIVVA